MNDFEKLLGQKAEEFSKYKYHALDGKLMLDLLNAGAETQRDFDAIIFIQESYCIDDFEEAKIFWKQMVESAEARKDKIPFAS